MMLMHADDEKDRPKSVKVSAVAVALTKARKCNRVSGPGALDRGMLSFYLRPSVTV